MCCVLDIRIDHSSSYCRVVAIAGPNSTQDPMRHRSDSKISSPVDVVISQSLITKVLQSFFTFNYLVINLIENLRRRAGGSARRGQGRGTRRAAIWVFRSAPPVLGGSLHRSTSMLRAPFLCMGSEEIIVDPLGPEAAKLEAALTWFV